MNQQERQENDEAVARILFTAPEERRNALISAALIGVIGIESSYTTQVPASTRANVGRLACEYAAGVLQRVAELQQIYDRKLVERLSQRG